MYVSIFPSLTRKRIVILLVFIYSCCFSLSLMAQSDNKASPYSNRKPMKIQSSDLVIKASANPRGYHLWIRRLPGTASIMLTESAKDPSFKEVNYALRVSQFYYFNGFEQRVLDDRQLKTEYNLWSVIDSTLEIHPVLGESFHLFLEEEMKYGYSWAAKEGKLRMESGVRINLRSFSALYCDYRGEFIDQWLTFKNLVKKEPQPVQNIDPIIKDEGPQLNETTPERVETKPLAGIDATLVKQSQLMTQKSPGRIFQATGKGTVADATQMIESTVFSSVDSTQGCDIVFVIDSTRSMEEEIPAFKALFPKIYSELNLQNSGKVRFAIVSYRDYDEQFVVKSEGFFTDRLELFRAVNRLSAVGGRDHEEALFEAVVKAGELEYQVEDRYLFLLADAPSHRIPKGSVSAADAFKSIEENRLRVFVLCFPDKKSE